ncbi:MAG: hypothetical protein KBA66_18410 [Leptospiraceae bacterium]|nr:hypothetical protein [Leptospiraceae bacterium]
MKKIILRSLVLLIIQVSLFYNCSSSNTVENYQSKPSLNTNPEITEMYLQQRKCSDLIGNCNSSCLKKFPYERFSPRNSSKRVSCEEECYQTLREKQNCIFYQSTSYR